MIGHMARVMARVYCCQLKGHSFDQVQKKLAEGQRGQQGEVARNFVQLANQLRPAPRKGWKVYLESTLHTAFKMGIIFDRCVFSLKSMSMAISDDLVNVVLVDACSLVSTNIQEDPCSTMSIRCQDDTREPDRPR